jgi:hypothetical protein
MDVGNRASLERRISQFYAEMDPQRLLENPNLAAETVDRWSPGGDSRLNSAGALQRGRSVQLTPPSPSRANLWDDVTRYGTLLKRSRWVKAWRSRFFVLRASRLEGYANEDSYTRAKVQPVPRMSVELAGARIHAQWTTPSDLGDSNHCNHFILVPGAGYRDDTRIHLAAEGAREARSWVSAIKRAIADATRRRASAGDSGELQVSRRPEKAMQRSQSRALFEPFAMLHARFGPQGELRGNDEPTRARRPSIVVAEASQRAAARRNSATSAMQSAAL